MLCDDGTLAIVTVIDSHHSAILLPPKFSIGPQFWGLVARSPRKGLPSPCVEGREEEMRRHSPRRESHWADTTMVVPGEKNIVHHCHAFLEGMSDRAVPLCDSLAHRNWVLGTWRSVHLLSVRSEGSLLSWCSAWHSFYSVKVNKCEMWGYMYHTLPGVGGNPGSCIHWH